LIEDFEHGNIGLYTQAGGSLSNASIVSHAAHSGNAGVEFALGSGPHWYYRTDIGTAPGANPYYGYVRFTETLTNKRVYLGVGAAATGTYSVVAAPNTSQLLLQQNTPYSTFTTIGTVAATYVPNTWYRIELLWETNGNMTGYLYDETRTNLLAQTNTAATGFTTPGGIAFRGFALSAGTGLSQLDDIGVVPEPASILLVGVGLALLARRRAR
jgi:hypothetical protein